MSYYMATEVAMSFEEAEARVREELQKEGFGVLTEIDVQATLKKKLGVDMPRYLILGACNPPFAHKAIQVEPRVGILLPCNVIVRETEDRRVEVSAVDPDEAMKMVDNADLSIVACEVREKLARVIDAMRT